MSTSEPKKRGDEAAKEWASERAEEFGIAVNFWRKRLQLTMVELSSRTKEIGYPITRATIAKIETNQRNSKVDFAEVVTLASALEVSPHDLVYFGQPSKKIRATPRAEMRVDTAVEWFSGSYGYNAFDSLFYPRTTQSEAKRQPIADFDRAVESFVTRFGPGEVKPGGRYMLSKAVKGDSKGEVNVGDKRLLEENYARIRELRERVLDAGGNVDLPGWIDCFKAYPF
ncbi:TPA: helix-turn-helix transcriptional regulator [Corynebacterium striatum]|nr:helix-turn-helix transcriptional regulator [Corynebacterium striatum]